MRPIKLSDTKELSICGGCSCFLKKLQLPNLASLSLKHYGCYTAPELPTSIRTLNLEGMGVGWFRDIPNSVQRLPNLTHITMVDVEVRLPVKFKLLAPNLQVLRISSLNLYDANSGRNNTVDLSTVIGLEGVFGLGEQLRELSITSMKLSHNSSSVLLLHPAIRKLALFKCRFRFGLLLSLTEETGINNAYLPNLAELRVQKCQTTQLSLTFEEFRNRCTVARPNLHIIDDDMDR
jgi:hypothetical protein